MTSFFSCPAGRPTRSLDVRTALCLTLLLLPIATASPALAVDGQLGARFLPLGVLSDHELGSFADAVSSDGSTVVGQAFYDGRTEAIMWTEAKGIVRLGGLAGFAYNGAQGISADKSMIVGSSRSIDGSGGTLFQWTSDAGLQPLAGCGCAGAVGAAISDDGLSIVSSRVVPGQGRLALRWRAETGPIDLGDFPGGNTESHAYDLTPDGKIVVGHGFTAENARGFRWTEETGLVELGPLMYAAYAVSDDGQAIAGVGFQNGQGAVRWTDQEGPVWMGHLPGLTGKVYSFASDISADGSVIVGGSGEQARFQAFRWTQAGGMQSVQRLLQELGIDTTGWTLGAASAVAGDGSVIVGTGTNPSGQQEGWVAVIPPTYIPEPRSALVMALGLGGLMMQGVARATRRHTSFTTSRSIGRRN